MKKSFSISIFAWLGALILGTSCGTSSTITYDYMLPAELTLPVELASMGIINHTPDSLYELSSKVTQVIAEDVSDARYFNDVHLLDSVITEPMTLAHVDDLARYMEVDFLVSLDSLELTLSRATTKMPEGEYHATAQIDVLGMVRLYLPGRSVPMTHLMVRDTLNWHGYSYDEKEALSFLPTIAVMASESTTYLGEKFADKLVPHWTTVLRALFVRESGELKEAAVNVHDNEWGRAAKKWEMTYNKTNSIKLKAYCAYNLAVYHEKLSEIDNAIEWIIKSAKHFEQVKHHKDVQDAALYLAFLQKRQKELQLLDLQFAE